jgi:hypothetical protein
MVARNWPLALHVSIASCASGWLAVPRRRLTAEPVHFTRCGFGVFLGFAKLFFGLFSVGDTHDDNRIPFSFQQMGTELTSKTVSFPAVDDRVL